ncbi:MAG TPA: RnfH family protein [Halomonas sp.]|nr:RnfH family protein [Halomonas sp.]
MAAETLSVEVAYALPRRQRIVALRVPEGTTARQAVTLADLPAHFPDVPEHAFTRAPLGIFGKALRNPETQKLREGDRVEIYRTLAIDPKAARLERAKRQASDQGR